MDESDFGGLQNLGLAILLPPSGPNSPSDGSTTAAPRALAWSALRGSALWQKVLEHLRKDVRRCV